MCDHVSKELISLNTTLGVSFLDDTFHMVSCCFWEKKKTFFLPISLCVCVVKNIENLPY